MLPMTTRKLPHRSQVTRIRLLLGLMTTFGVALTVLTPPNAISFAQEKQPEKGNGKTSARERFDMLVRDDFFSGFTGKKERLDKAMKACEEALAKNPNHAEALVWHGCGLMFQSAALFQSGDTQKGIAQYQKGLLEMDRAVKLEPSNIAVLIPRAAALLPSARYMPDPDFAKTLYDRVASDYEKTYAIQKPGFSKLSEHSRGELLFGLAEVQVRLGKEDQARAYLKQILATCKEADYRKEAQSWLDKKPLVGSDVSHKCIGCHIK